MKDNTLGFSIESTEVLERDYTNTSNMQTDSNIREFANKIRLEDILKYLPRKILIRDKVYTLTLVVSNKYCTLNYYCNIDEETGKRKYYPEEEVLNPLEPWMFYKEYLAYIILHISKLLAQINAVEIDEKLNFVGNAKIIKSYDILIDYCNTEITDYEERLEEIRQKYLDDYGKDYKNI